jgi:hypothetical protein
MCSANVRREIGSAKSAARKLHRMRLQIRFAGRVSLTARGPI